MRDRRCAGGGNQRSIGAHQRHVDLRITAVDAQDQRRGFGQLARRTGGGASASSAPGSQPARMGSCGSWSTVTKSAPDSRSSAMTKGSAAAVVQGQPCISTIAPSPCARTPSTIRRNLAGRCARCPIAAVHLPAHVPIAKPRECRERASARVDGAKRAAEPGPGIYSHHVPDRGRRRQHVRGKGAGGQHRHARVEVRVVADQVARRGNLARQSGIGAHPPALHEHRRPHILCRQGVDDALRDSLARGPVGMLDIERERDAQHA